MPFTIDEYGDMEPEMVQEVAVFRLCIWSELVYT